MVKSPRAIVPAIAGAIVLLGACDPSAVEINFEPGVGDVYRYQSEIRTEFERVIDDEVDTSGSERTRLAATEEVVAVDGDEMTLDIALERDGVPARSHSVQLAHGDHFSAIDLISHDSAENLGLDLATTDLTTPPSGPLEVGFRWDIDGSVDGAAPGAPSDQTPVTGTGRVRALGVDDGHDVVIVDVRFEMPIESRIATPSGLVRMSGTQTTESTSTYDLADGSLRTHRQRITASADLVVDPPEGVAAQPAPGSLTYRLTANTTRSPVAGG